MEKLFKIFEKLEKVINRYEFIIKKLYEFESISISEEDFYYQEKLKDEKILLDEDIKFLLKKVLKYSNKYEYYFSDCSKETYFKKLPERLELFKQRNKEELPELYDFIIDEFRYLNNKDRMHTIEFNNTVIDYTRYWELIFDFKVFTRQKKDILSSYITRIEKSHNEFYLDENGNMIERPESELLAQAICKHLKSFEKFNKGSMDEMDYLIKSDAPPEMTIVAEMNLENKLEETKNIVTENIKKLYKQSLKDNFLFFDCPFDVYKNHYEERKNKYLNENIDAEEADFITGELNSFINPASERILLDDKTFKYNDFLENSNCFSISLSKKIEYLKTLLESLGWDAYLIEDENHEPWQYKFEKNDKYVNPFENSSVSTKENNKKNDSINDVLSIDKKQYATNEVNSSSTNKIKWSAGPSTLGYILGYLDSLGYIETPKRQNKETNYSAFARQVLETFDIDSTEDTLKKYLNLDSEKSKQIGEKFKERGIEIPHSSMLF